MSRKHVVIIATLMFAEITSTFEQSSALAGMGQWLREYKDPVAVGWIVTAYMLVAASAAAICGRLADILGRKFMLLVILGFCTVGSITSALAISLEWIIAGRALQGFAGAIIPLCYALARELLPKEQVPSVIGMIVAIAGVGSTMGLLAGGVLTDAFGANSVFWASAAIAGMAGVMALLTLPNSGPPLPGTKIDYVGGVLFAPALAAILLGFGNSDSGGWMDWTSGGLVLLGVVLTAVWVIHELRCKNPLIDVRLLANRHILMGNIIIACLAIGAFQVSQLLSMMLQQPAWTVAGLGLSATAVGLLRLPNMVSGGTSSLLSGWASGRFGPRMPMLLGTSIVLVAFAIAIFEHASIPFLIAFSVLTSVGVSMTYAAAPNVILSNTPTERTGEVAGLMAVFRSISRAAGAQILVLLLATSTVTDPETGVNYPDDAAYTLVLVFMAVLAAISLVLTLFLPHTSPVNPKLRAQRL